MPPARAVPKKSDGACRLRLTAPTGVLESVCSREVRRKIDETFMKCLVLRAIGAMDSATDFFCQKGNIQGKLWKENSAKCWNTLRAFRYARRVKI